MQATKRKHAVPVIALLLAEPQRFTFTQMLSLLLRELRRQGVDYERAFRERITFRNSLSLSFPASEIQEIAFEPGAHAARGSLGGGPEQIHITPAFIGLLGASGTLPLHDTERIAARKALDADTSQRDLLDMLSNRSIGLFYEAWGKYRVEHGLDVRGQDRLLPMLTALAGAAPSASQGRPATRIRQETSAYLCGLLRTRPVSATTIERVLTHHFGVQVRLEQFVGDWYPIPENRRSTLGVMRPVLGAGAALGVRQWRHDRCARLHIGALAETQVRGFLPGGDALAALAELIRLFAAPTLLYQVRLLLAPPSIKRCSLNTRTPPRQLGWDTFLTGTPGVTRRPEINMALRLHTGVKLEPAKSARTSATRSPQVLFGGQ